MNDLQWHPWLQPLYYFLNQGQPPLYVQFAVATAVFVVLRIYFFWKHRKFGSLVPSPEWLTTAWLGVLILLSLGAVDYMQYIYREYLRTIYYNIVT